MIAEDVPVGQGGAALENRTRRPAHYEIVRACFCDPMCRRVALPQRKRGRQPFERQYLSEGEVAVLAAVLDETEPVYVPLVSFAAYTGLRAGEKAGLDVAHVDLLRRWVPVPCSALGRRQAGRRAPDDRIVLSVRRRLRHGRRRTWRRTWRSTRATGMGVAAVPLAAPLPRVPRGLAQLGWALGPRPVPRKPHQNGVGDGRLGCRRASGPTIFGSRTPQCARRGACRWCGCLAASVTPASRSLTRSTPISSQPTTP